MSTTVLYTKGAKVWLPDPVDVWKTGEILEDFKSDKLKIILDSKEEIELTIKDQKDLPPLRNPEFLIGGNDLTSLSYLHEPAVLHTLKVRFMNYNAIYTYCGIVLVAINPYQELPIYSQDTVLAYRNKNQYGSLDPHIFAVAEEAFTKMERENQDQSIIVSGESGAGKTVSAKYAMRYFATAGGSATETQVERKVLASSPIMEAIGNAKTTRNDNSSRFGKYIQLGFNNQFHIQGAGMRTYLLEKSRVVFQSTEERNYHIFYQLCAASTLPEMAYLQLEHQDNFIYTSQGGCPTIDGVDDLADFQETRRALSLLGFGEDQQADMFRILAALLHLGNVKIVDADHEGSNIARGDTYLASFCNLIGLDQASSEEIRKWLCYRQIVSMKEVFTKPMTKAEASFARDALAKHVYSLLFQKIVTMINKSLDSSSRAHRFIGVLDIYGFETFEWNSFEQFCINYANEKLQQQFNQHVFKLEQEEYVREKIEWTFIDYYDNQPCIDLIERPLGILDLLDEECRVPKGADQTWVEKLYDQCKKYTQFVKPRLSNSAFIIVHFADRVEYQSQGFVEKNRDTVLDEQVQILRNSSNTIVRNLILDEEANPSITGARSPSAAAAGSRTVVGTVPRGGGNLLAPAGAKQYNTMTKQNRRTVGSQFRESLTLLMKTLNATTPHYVRCIKPNDSKESFVFDPRRAVQQLRACGVLETVRISAAGFPSRLTYEEFKVRYRVLFHSSQCQRTQLRESCETVLGTLITEEDKFKFGASKIFFRAGQVAYLEKRRTDKLRACGILVQRMIRGWFYRKRYLMLRKAAISGQRFGRGYLARRKAQRLRENRSAIVIQKHVRGFVQRQVYKRLRHSVLQLQTYGRGFLARKRYLQMVCNAKAVLIQKMVRGFLARRRYIRARKGIVLLQSCWRRWLARRQYKALRVEARSIEHVKNLNKGLENKIISMQQKIEEMNKELNQLRHKQGDYADLKAQCDANRGLSVELKSSVTRIGELELLVNELRAQLDRERDEKMDLVQDRAKLEKSNQDLADRIENMHQELLESTETNQTRNQEAEDAIKRRLDQERAILAQEYDQERAAYQKLLQDYREMEERTEEAERELEELREEQGKGSKGVTVRGHSRNASNVSTLSNTSELIPDPEDDGGYMSVRNSSTPAVGRPEGEDVGLVLKLQQRLKTVEKDKTSLMNRVEELERESPTADVRRAQDMIRLQELEMENAKLKDDLKNLRRQSATENETQLPRSLDMLMSQFDTMSDELDRRREECIQLRTVLANTTLSNQLGDMTALNSSRLNGGDQFGEDNEILLAFETQKRIIRHLENELQEEKASSQRKVQKEREEVERLRADNDRQQKVLAGALHRTPQGQTEAVMQHEIARLTTDNLDLQEKSDLLAEQLKKYKSQTKLLSKKLKDAGISLDNQESPHEAQEAGQSTRKMERSETLPILRKKETNYLGMFEFNMGDEKQIARNLVYELKPRIAINLPPGLPSYIIFMCVRHADYINNDEKIRSFLTLVINAIRRLIKKRYEDLDTSVFWLVNTCRLLHCLKQYSGEKTFQEENTTKQNEQCLRNFDLSEYRQVLSDIAVWIYQAVIKFMEEQVQPHIVAAVLEHEAIAGLSSHKQPVGQGGRARTGSTRETASDVDPQEALDKLLHNLTQFAEALRQYGVDPTLVAQAFRQVFYYICACALNNLLLRKEMCHWSKGIQIRYNISHLEQWVRDQNIHGQDLSTPITDTLQPIIQAAQLLQARKSEDDVVNICNMCSRLTSAQIIKILNLYTPADELEDRIPMTFIRKVQEELQKRSDLQAQSKLLMDTKFAFTVRFPFSPSSMKLEDIEIPSVLNLPMLKKV